NAPSMWCSAAATAAPRCSPCAATSTGAPPGLASAMRYHVRVTALVMLLALLADRRDLEHDDRDLALDHPADRRLGLIQPIRRGEHRVVRRVLRHEDAARRGLAARDERLAVGRQVLDGPVAGDIGDRQ